MTVPVPPPSARTRDPAESLLGARLGLMLLDLVVVQAAAHFWLGWNLGRSTPEIDGQALVLMMFLQIIVFSWRACYQVAAHWPYRTWYRTAIEGLVALTALLLAVLYLAGMGSSIPRLAFAGWFLSSLAGLALVRLPVSIHLRQAARRSLPRVILAGDPSRCLVLEVQLAQDPQRTMIPVAIAIAGGQALPGCELPVVDVAHLDAAVDEHHAQRVIVCAAPDDDGLVEQVLDVCGQTTVEVALAPDLSRYALFCMRLEEAGGVPLINLSASPMDEGDQLLKRLEDLVLATIILVLIALPMAIIALLIRIDSPGPVLFIQNRHGYMGRTIRVFKFRTMHWEPPAPPPPVAASRPTTATVFRQAVANDQRVTRLGRWLRRTSLDELPQFLNVLIGDMSIVGPRPHVRRQNLTFASSIPYLMRRHYVKPGITGLAQISGARGRTDGTAAMRRRISLDLEYIRRWSLWLDLRIIAATIFVGFWTDEP